MKRFNFTGDYRFVVSDSRAPLLRSAFTRLMWKFDLHNGALFSISNKFHHDYTINRRSITFSLMIHFFFDNSNWFFYSINIVTI